MEDIKYLAAMNMTDDGSCVYEQITSLYDDDIDEGEQVNRLIDECNRVGMEYDFIIIVYSRSSGDRLHEDGTDVFRYHHTLHQTVDERELGNYE